MIDCVFTIDYEIYGNGEGSLRELVYEPAERLVAIFDKWDARFVSFVEVAEFEMIEAAGSDPDIHLVKQQIRKFHETGFELGLHLHPQWYNARHEKGKWVLDYQEYNLCTLSPDRISQIVQRSMDYLRKVIGDSEFIPISFRAGNWLFQPTQAAATVLADQGIKVDSSVFKGGVQHKHSLDYRRALKNGYYWNFSDDVNIASTDGMLLELPIYTQMVPIWKMFTAKRVGMQRKSSSSSQATKGRMGRIRDLLRLQYPLKFDFCRMTLDELISMVDREYKKDQDDPSTYRPLVAIGHTKDLVDFVAVDAFLSYLRQKKIAISTFEQALDNVRF
ncbi:MAG: hypothetical protein KKE17_04305 [Proteobacteria bacterium]|nr:hypothetical protein [Pseudomonadota bacterium]MBU1709208.1 hypothetical protein [Pseudomonadota bacterium]